MTNFGKMTPFPT